MQAYFHDEGDIHGESLHSVEAGDEGDGEEALRVHLSPQEEVPFQVVEAEVVLTEEEEEDDDDVNAFSPHQQHQFVISFIQEHTFKVKTMS